MRAARTPHAMASKASGEQQGGSETLVAKSKQQNVKNEYSLSRGTEHRAAYRAPQWQQAQLAAARCAASRLRTMDRGSSWGAPARERACAASSRQNHRHAPRRTALHASAAPSHKQSCPACTDGERCCWHPAHVRPMLRGRCLPPFTHHVDLVGRLARPAPQRPAERLGTRQGPHAVHLCRRRVCFARPSGNPPLSCQNGR